MRDCGNCGGANPPEAKFCMECGKPLSLACSACGTAAPDSAKFCMECGEALGGRTGSAAKSTPITYTPRHLTDKILRTRSAVEGERKHVTVMFADVTESMSLAGQVDPETWHGILDGFFGILANGVHRYEGTVNQYTGDGIMALFGAPIAHEDHAQRACYAALSINNELAAYADEMRRRHGLNFSVRIGLNSGEVVVGKIGDDLRMDYTAQGHSVGLAARVEAIAAPNTIYVTGNVADLAASYLDFTDLGEFSLKGVDLPMRVYRLDGMGSARMRLDISQARGFSRFVGRSDELAHLEALFDRAADHGLQVVNIVADAGTGKSRLCYEFEERCKDREIPFYAGHCVAHGNMIPFLPVLDILRDYLGVGTQDDDETARTKIAGRLFMLDESLKDALPLVFEFLGVSDPAHPAPATDPETKSVELFQALEKMLKSSTPEERGVIMIEDLHWIDGASDKVLRALIDMFADAHEMVLVNTRPGYSAPWMRLPNYTEIRLRPLDERAVAELLDDLLGDDPSLKRLRATITENTAGNPYYVEEVVRALAESGVLNGCEGAYELVGNADEVVVPSSVRDVIAARIDRLTPEQKEMLEVASVIGKRAGECLVVSVAEQPEATARESLAALIDLGFLAEGTVYPEFEYVFYHPLIQEVAYRTQLGERRKATHRRVAEALEDDCGCKRDENIALLAHHWDGAGDTLQAVVWRRKAAEWAAIRDLAEAGRHWQRVLELLADYSGCEQSDAVAIAAREALIDIGMKIGNPLSEARELLDDGLAIAHRRDDRASAARLLASYAMAESFAGKVDAALARMEEAVVTADQSDNISLSIFLHARLGYMKLLSGQLEESIDLLDYVFELTRKQADVGEDSNDPIVEGIWFEAFKSLPLAYRGELVEATRLVDTVIERLHGAEDGSGEATVRGFGVTTAWFRGDRVAALRHAREQVRLAEEKGTPTLIASAYDSLGVGLALDGRFDEAREASGRALATAEGNQTMLQSQPVFLANSAAAELGVGNFETAIEMAREAANLARDRHTPLFECRARIVLARSLLAGTPSPAAIKDADDTLSRALAIVEHTGAHGYEPFVRAERARLALLSGDDQAARSELAKARELFQSMGATAYLDSLAPSETLSASRN